MNQGVYNTVVDMVPAFNEWERSSKAPTGPEVNGWVQQKTDGVNPTEYINQGVYNTIEAEIPPMQWARSANAPTGPVV